jgi:hypothetical protein
MNTIENGTVGFGEHQKQRDMENGALLPDHGMATLSTSTDYKKSSQVCLLSSLNDS